MENKGSYKVTFDNNTLYLNTATAVLNATKDRKVKCKVYGFIDGSYRVVNMATLHVMARREKANSK